jgi:hypothetical protein
MSANRVTLLPRYPQPGYLCLPIGDQPCTRDHRANSSPTPVPDRDSTPVWIASRPNERTNRRFEPDSRPGPGLSRHLGREPTQRANERPIRARLPIPHGASTARWTACRPNRRTNGRFEPDSRPAPTLDRHLGRLPIQRANERQPELSRPRPTATWSRLDRGSRTRPATPASARSPANYRNHSNLLRFLLCSHT